MIEREYAKSRAKAIVKKLRARLTKEQFEYLVYSSRKMGKSLEERIVDTLESYLLATPVRLNLPLQTRKVESHKRRTISPREIIDELTTDQTKEYKRRGKVINGEEIREETAKMIEKMEKEQFERYKEGKEVLFEPWEVNHPSPSVSLSTTPKKQLKKRSRKPVKKQKK